MMHGQTKIKFTTASCVMTQKSAASRRKSDITLRHHFPFCLYTRNSQAVTRQIYMKSDS